MFILFVLGYGMMGIVVYRAFVEEMPKETESYPISTLIFSGLWPMLLFYAAIDALTGKTDDTWS